MAVLCGAPTPRPEPVVRSSRDPLFSNEASLGITIADKARGAAVTRQAPEVRLDTWLKLEGTTTRQYICTSCTRDPTQAWPAARASAV